MCVNDLVRAKIHLTSIIAGYRLAMREVRSLSRQLCQICNSKECTRHVIRSSQ
jgi:chaperonin GroEL (HSP60 family)